MLPDMYTISGPNETIRDLIVRAGGTTDSAAARIILTPAPPKRPDQPAAAQPEPDSSADPSVPSSSDTNPLSVSGASDRP